MKNKLLFLCGVVLTCCSGETAIMEEGKVLAPVESRSSDSQIFKFPDVDWGSFDTHEQKLAACEIPESLLSQIPTEELTKICMDYPFIFDAYAFNTPLEGMRKVVSRFNGFQELMSRKDNCKCIFNYIKRKDIRNANLSALTIIENGKTTLLYSLCEYLLSFDKVLNNADDVLRKDIATFSNEILYCKENEKKYFALGGLTSSLYLLSSVTFNNRIQKNTVNPTISRFLDSGIILNENDYFEIKNLCLTSNL